MPYFLVDFSGPSWPFITYEYFRSSFVSGQRFSPSVESIHFISEKDEMYPALKNYRNFEKPEVIHHDQGHRPVRTLPMKELRISADFFIRQYETKNGHRSQDPKVE